MKNFILPIVIVVALLAGGGGGYFLKSSGLIMNEPEEDTHTPADTDAEDSSHHEAADAHKKDKKAGSHSEKPEAPETFRFREQFIVPVLDEGLPSAILVLDLEIELDKKTLDKASAYESRLRDLFMEILLQQGARGSLRDIVYESPARLFLKDELRDAAITVVGDGVSSVYIHNVGIQRY